MRLSLLTRGRMPETRVLPTPWWATPNIHLCTLKDFAVLAGELGLFIEAAAALGEGRPARPIDPARAIENWRAESALLLLRRAENAPPAPARRDAVALPKRSTDLFG